MEERDEVGSEKCYCRAESEGHKTSEIHAICSGSNDMERWEEGKTYSSEFVTVDSVIDAQRVLGLVSLREDEISTVLSKRVP